MKNRKLRALKFGETVRKVAEIVKEELPQITDNQLLIQNRYAGVNGLFDRSIVRNELPYRFLQPPLYLGVEAIGTIMEVGQNVKNFSDYFFYNLQILETFLLRNDEIISN
jgi:NADPH:quinone reductase-like Zn-dependent oxidoreductase